MRRACGDVKSDSLLVRNRLHWPAFQPVPYLFRVQGVVRIQIEAVHEHACELSRRTWTGKPKHARQRRLHALDVTHRDQFLWEGRMPFDTMSYSFTPLEGPVHVTHRMTKHRRCLHQLTTRLGPQHHTLP